MDETSSQLQDRIDQIIAAIDRIQTYIQGVGKTSFVQNTLIQDAVIRNLEVIGEAAGRIEASDPGFAQCQGHLRLDLAYRMRNALIHGYDSVNLTTVWSTITNDLPVLRDHLEAIAREAPGSL